MTAQGAPILVDANVILDVVTDDYIGAHAAVHQLPFLTRDTGRSRTYFSTLDLIAPSANTGERPEDEQDIPGRG
jgi:hypothetical protein